ncbi:MAG: tetratricopeptide repeat protein [Chitinophagaceae bacterium]|nr:tetratricopeptide repeat protein [Chitinophagaceae bacterium]
MRKHFLRILLQLVCSILLFGFCRAQSSNTIADSLQQLLRAKPEKDSNRVTILLNLSHSIVHENPDSSMKIAEQALVLSRELKWQKGIALSVRQKGLIYYFQSDFVKAIEFSQQALKEASSLKHTLLDASIYNNIANVYADMGYHEKALDYYMKLLDAAKQARHRIYEMNALINIGTVYLEQKKYSRALEYLNQGLAIAKADNNNSIASSVYNNIGIAYKNMNRLQESLQNLEQSFNLAKESNNLNTMAVSLSDMAEVFIMLKDYKKAQQYASESLKYSAPLKALQWQGNAYQILSLALEKQGRYQESMDAYKNHVMLRDSVMNDEKKQEINRKEIQFEFEKKEALLKAENEKKVALANAEINRQRIVRNAVIGGILVLLVSTVTGLILYKRKRDAEQQQKEAEFKTRVTDTEMKALRAQMNPHFIFNSLNSVADYMAKNNTKLADEYLTKFAKLMRMILENSEQKEVLLVEDLKALELYMQLEALRMNHKFTYEIKVDEEIDQENTLVPPLILQPFVENSIWHGIAQKDGHGKITIKIKKEGGMINCIVEDDGIGRTQSSVLAPPLDQSGKKSLGMKITTARIDIINKVKKSAAAIQLSDLQQGTRVEVKLPLELNF